MEAITVGAPSEPRRWISWEQQRLTERRGSVWVVLRKVMGRGLRAMGAVVGIQTCFHPFHPPLIFWAAVSPHVLHFAWESEEQKCRARSHVRRPGVHRTLSCAAQPPQQTRFVLGHFLFPAGLAQDLPLPIGETNVSSVSCTDTTLPLPSWHSAAWIRDKDGLQERRGLAEGTGLQGSSSLHHHAEIPVLCCGICSALL